MKIITEVKIIENLPLSQIEPAGDENIFLIKMELKSGYADSKPGQFVNVYLNNQSKLLPRPISIYDHYDNVIELLYAVTGEGTAELSTYKNNQTIRISSPLGNGFDLYSEDIKKIVLVGGGMGIAPLHYLAKSIHKQESVSGFEDVKAVFGFNGQPFLLNEIKKYTSRTVVCSENPQKSIIECVKGNVLDGFAEIELENSSLFCCGPSPMLKAVSIYSQNINNINLQVSLEERMGCGFGVCVGCTVKLKSNSDENCDKHEIIQKKVCKDGPVFAGNEVIWND